MIYILISIFFSVSVAGFLKITKQRSISTFQLIHVNYLVAIFLCAILYFNTNFKNVKIVLINHWVLYTILGLLLPTIFLILSKSIEKSGIIKTDISQRFSLIIPLLFSIIFWKQDLNIVKYIGLILGFISIFLILYKKKENLKGTSIYPIFVLIGYGIIDVLFKKIALIKDIPYTTSLFFIFIFAFIFSSIIGLILLKKNKTVYNKKHYKYGAFLGVLNFVNIFTYLKAHQVLKDNPAIVFSTMNFGVIILSAIIGYFYFKEKLNIYNTIGIFISLLAIALVTLF